VFTGHADSFVQVALKNFSDGESASTDIIAYASNGDNDSGWIGIGITSENFNDPAFSVTGPDTGYLFMSAPAGTTATGNLLIGTSDTGVENDIIIFSNGFDGGNERLRIVGEAREGHALGIEILAPTESTSTTTGALRVNGGLGLIGNLNVGGNVEIVGTISIGGEGSSLETTTLSVSDPMIIMGNGNTVSDSVDLGFYGIYGSSGTKHAGLVRDASDGKFKLFTSLATAPTTTVDFTGVTYADFLVGNLTTSGNVDIPANKKITLGGSAGTDGKFLKTTASGMEWADAAVQVSDITTNGTYYPLFTTATSGTVTSANVTSTKFSFNPNTGTLTAGNKLSLLGTSSGSVSFQAASAAGSVTYTLPSADGTSGYALVTNGSGTLSWAAAGAVITDDTSTTTLYPTMSTASTGNFTAAKVSSTKLTFNASTGVLTTSGGYVESSSITYKENVNPIGNALDAIMQLVGVTYDRKDGSRKGEVGLIAEEVDKVIPNLVDKSETGSADGIFYSKLTAYLVEAIKTLKSEIDPLKEEIKRLKGE
jgi:hypothetical protein